MDKNIIARKALEHITKEGIKPSPATLSVWFLYFEGVSPALTARIKSFQATGKPISEEDYAKLYESYVIKSYVKESLGIARSTNKIIKKAHDIKERVTDFAEAMKSHCSSLNGMKDELSVAETREIIEAVLSEAILELKVVEKSSIETTLYLDKEAKLLASANQDVVNIEKDLHRDFLTGLPDFSMFQARMETVLEKTLSGIITRSYFVVFDICRLDYYNKEFSWLLGDSIIRLVSKLITNSLAEDWFIMRLYNDEIAVVPPAHFPIQDLPNYIEKVQSVVASKKLVAKQMSKSIDPIKLNAAIIKVEAYDDFSSISKKIKLAESQMSATGDIVKIDKL